VSHAAFTKTRGSSSTTQRTAKRGKLGPIFLDLYRRGSDAKTTASQEGFSVPSIRKSETVSLSLGQETREITFSFQEDNTLPEESRKQLLEELESYLQAISPQLKTLEQLETPETEQNLAQVRQLCKEFHTLVELNKEDRKSLGVSMHDKGNEIRKSKRDINIKLAELDGKESVSLWIKKVKDATDESASNEQYEKNLAQMKQDREVFMEKKKNIEEQIKTNEQAIEDILYKRDYWDGIDALLQRGFLMPE
jgi:hypothetical protein